MALVLLLSLLSLGAADNALNLSRYLSSPSIGRNLSLVALPAPFASLVSHSGLFEIAPGRYTFFWFFPHPTNPAAPTMTWLQGGPGASSMFGLFSEHGPFSVAADGVTLVPRATACA
jgi:vitellogenic carboxypeptidase-like protein